MSDGQHAVVGTIHDSIELGTLRGTKPHELLNAAAAMATPLAKLIDDQKLYVEVNKRKYVFCEGWTTLAAMCGVTPHEVSTVEKDGVYVSTMELRRITDGQPVGRASAECGADDEVDRQGRPLWSKRAQYARRSMAQTRATSKVCRLVFSWIMVLAGYAATPAEEMTDRGVPTIPGKPGSWGGYGGKPITRVPEGILATVVDWLKKKGEKKNAKMIDAIELELDGRRESAEGEGATAEKAQEGAEEGYE